MLGTRRKERKTPNPNTCEQCPYRYTELGCPCWITPEYGFVEQEEVSGRERIVTGCFYKVMPKLMVHVIKNVNRPLPVIESLRNTIAKGFRMVAHQGLQIQQQVGGLPKDLRLPKPDTKMIEKNGKQATDRD